MSDELLIIHEDPDRWLELEVLRSENESLKAKVERLEGPKLGLQVATASALGVSLASFAVAAEASFPVIVGLLGLVGFGFCLAKLGNRGGGL